MKNLLFFLLISTTTLAQVTLPTNEAGQVQYQEIVRLPEATRPAREVYNQLRAWSEKHYVPSNEAELQRDDVHGILFVRSFYAIGNQDIRYTLTIEAKIGRYRATLTDLVARADGLTLPITPNSSTTEDMARNADTTAVKAKVVEQVATDQAELYRQIDRACRATLASLKEAMTAKSK